MEATDSQTDGHFVSDSPLFAPSPFAFEGEREGGCRSFVSLLPSPPSRPFVPSAGFRLSVRRRLPPARPFRRRRWRRRGGSFGLIKGHLPTTD